MNEFDRLSKIFKEHQDALDKLHLEPLMTDSLKAFRDITSSIMDLHIEPSMNTSFEAFRNLTSTFRNIYPEPPMNSTFETFKNLTSAFKDIYPEPPMNSTFDAIKNLTSSFKDLYPELPMNSTFETFKNLTSTFKDMYPEPPMNSTFEVIKNLTSSFKDLYPELPINNNSYSDALLNIDFLNNLNFAVTETIDNILRRTDHDDKDNEIVNNLSSCALEMTISKKLPFSVKKNILLNLAQNFWKLLGIPQFSFLFAIIVFIFSQIIPEHVSEKIIIKQTIKEIIFIEKENKELNLRGIINNGTKIYKSPKCKSSLIFTLDCGDIVEIIKIHKKWVYIKVYRTNIEGWVLKKYTKKSHSLNSQPNPRPKS